MADIFIVQHLNQHEVPVKGENESEQDFNARMEWFRKHDKRIAVAGLGMVNFSFPIQYTLGNPVFNNRQSKPHEVWEEGYPTGEYVKKDVASGGWGLPKE